MSIAHFHHFPHPSTMRLLLRYPSPMPQFQSRLALLHQLFFVALLTQIECVDFTTFLNYHFSNLPVSNRFFAASIVAPIDGPLWFTESASHEAHFLCWLTWQGSCVKPSSVSDEAAWVLTSASVLARDDLLPGDRVWERAVILRAMCGLSMTKGPGVVTWGRVEVTGCLV